MGAKSPRWKLVLILLVVLAAACASGGLRRPEDLVFYPPPPETPRIQFLASISDERDVGRSAGWLTSFLYGAERPAGFLKPYGIDVHDGKIFVVDTIAVGVAVLDIRKKSVETLGSKGLGRLRKPINIGVASDGMRYVTDRGHARVMVYDSDNKYVTAFGEPEEWAPTDIEVIGDELYVADRENGHIYVLDRQSGEEIQKIGREGIEEAEFLFPSNLAVADDGSIYVSDTMNYRIQKVDPDGRLLRQFGEAGDGLGNFARPKGIAVDRENRLYAVDSAFMNIQIFDDEGRLLLVLGKSGAGPGDMYLPAQVLIDYDNIDLFRDMVAPGHEVEYLIFVTNQYGPNKINVYGFLRQAEEDD